MVECALMVLAAGALGFGLGWLLRTFRLHTLEAAANGKIQSLQLQLEQSFKELSESRAAHTELRRQHFDESTARASAEAVARQLPALN
ncbi:MAG: hypothetical protein JO042_08645, partial [Sinobacteraceae bacterium]|nr:hypothetical protein [Nevskiaceae bacterium]